MKAQFFSLLAGRGVASLMLVAMGVLVARWAGPAEFGVLATVLSAGAVFFVLFDFGMSTYISRSQARLDLPAVSAALKANTATSFVGGLLGLGVLSVVASIYGLPFGIVLLGAALALEKNTETALCIPIAQGRKSVPVQSLMLRRVIALGTLVALHELGLGPLDSYGLSFLVGSVAGQVHIRSSLRNSYKVSPSGERIYRLAFPFLISNVSASVRNMDVALVTAAIGSQAGGLYAAAQRLTSPFMLIPGVIASLVLPHAARGSQQRGLALMKRLVLVHIVLLVILGVASLFAESICVLVLGAEYTGSGEVLAWLLLAFPFIALSSPMGGILQSQGHERSVAVNGISFAVVLVPALWAGAVFDGPAGAAIGMLVVYVLKCLSLFGLSLRNLR